MRRELAPAFQFYVGDWRGSRHVQRMTYAERGMLLEMLCEQWEKGAVPASPEACAALLGGTKAEWTRGWKKLAECFTARKRDGLLVNAKLERVRRARLKFKKTQRESGLRGAQVRWKQHGKPIGSLSKPIASPMAKNSSSSSSSSLSSTSSSTAGTAPPPRARSKRPIFSGQRLVVFEWQLGDLMRMLGSHADAFDLHAWFFTLDARAVASQCVIPQRDSGAWLQGETLTEAIRRGLPIARARRGGQANDPPRERRGEHPARGAAMMTLQAFASLFAELAIQLRQTDADEATIRVYYEALKDVEFEFLEMAADRLARSSEWFPKTSEWRAMAVKVEAEKREAQRALLRKLPAPLCLVCADTGWAHDADGRVKVCECQHLRRLELLGRLPCPALPEAPPADQRKQPLEPGEAVSLMRVPNNGRGGAWGCGACWRIGKGKQADDGCR